MNQIMHENKLKGSMNSVFYVISDWFMTLFIERPSYDPSLLKCSWYTVSMWYSSALWTLADALAN